MYKTDDPNTGKCRFRPTYIYTEQFQSQTEGLSRSTLYTNGTEFHLKQFAWGYWANNSSYQQLLLINTSKSVTGSQQLILKAEHT